MFNMFAIWYSIMFSILKLHSSWNPKKFNKKNPTDPTWCQQVIDEDQEFLIGDLSIGEEEENAFILHTSLGIHGLQISLQIVHAIAATSDQWTMETGKWELMILMSFGLWHPLAKHISIISEFLQASFNILQTKVIRATKKIYGSSWWLGFHQGADDNHHGLIQTLDLLKGVPKNKKSSL